MNLKGFPLFPIMFSITFIVLGLCINMLQLFFFITSSNIRFRKLNFYLMYAMYGYLLSLGDWWSGSKIRIYCSRDLQDKMKKREVDEHALILMNHHTELDWLYTWMMGDRLGILGNCRAFAKDSLKYVPVIGWAWAMSDMIFLKRDWEKDQVTMMKSINKLLDYPSPIWLLLFPEGTRFTEGKHRVSLEFAAQSGFPQLEHHLTPRTKGFSYLVENVDRDKLKTVYDVTLVKGEGPAPFNLNSILCGLETNCNIYIRSISIDTVPIARDKSASWLHNLFKEKDDLKKNFLETGNFYKSCTYLTHPRGIATLGLLVVPNLLVHIPLVITIFYSGWIFKTILMILGGISMLTVQIIGNSTRISKSSEYGSNNNKSC